MPFLKYEHLSSFSSKEDWENCPKCKGRTKQLKSGRLECMSCGHKFWKD